MGSDAGLAVARTPRAPDTTPAPHGFAFAGMPADIAYRVSVPDDFVRVTVKHCPAFILFNSAEEYLVATPTATQLAQSLLHICDSNFGLPPSHDGISLK
mmetsp:Transcript_138905/g.432137  ORF Transcript_138905/g.432137 Transcript_138905/m.432137 type:complete len:99 (+) Transcript_138905:233-529(+)